MTFVGSSGVAGYLPRSRVVDLCSVRLLEIGSPLADDHDVWKGCSRLAVTVVEDCVRSMDGNRISIDRYGVRSAAELGTLMLDRGIPVVEALRAGAMLCDVVADVLMEPPRPTSNRRWIALRAAQLSVALRIESFVTAYAARDQQRRRSDRQMLARELHDYVGANISLAQRHLELARLYGERRHPSAVLEAQAAERVLQDVLAGTRRLLHDLRAQPPVSGLGLALRTFVTSTAPDAEVGVHICGDEWLLGDSKRTEIYLICQEGLRNAFAHARANHVSVHVHIDADWVHAVIEDDGMGFAVDHGPAPGHHGLTGMRERTELMEGTFELTSVPGGGTRAEVRVPSRGRGRTAS